MKSTEKLLAAPLPDLVQGLGNAVATANKKLSDNKENNIVFAIDQAEIEIKVAISIDNKSEVGVELGGGISVFNVNASYKATFGYKEEASSRIKLHLSAKPREEEIQPPDDGDNKKPKDPKGK